MQQLTMLCYIVEEDDISCQLCAIYTLWVGHEDSRLGELKVKREPPSEFPQPSRQHTHKEAQDKEKERRGGIDSSDLYNW
jgi:hypothetical protein